MTIKLIKYLLTPLLIYLTCAFITMQMDASRWDIIVRIVCVIMTMSFTAITYIVSDDK